MGREGEEGRGEGGGGGGGGGGLRKGEGGDRMSMSCNVFSITA